MPPPPTGTMRRAVDAVCVLAAIAVLTVVGFALSASFREKATLSGTTRALDQFRRVLSIQAAAKEREHHSSGWPDTIELAWFPENVPRNTLLTPDRPWVEIAPPELAELSDPPVRIAVSTAYAGFWYNPANGIIRARVPLKMSEAASVALYNQINGADIDEGYEPFTPKPVPLPAPEPVKKDKAGLTIHKPGELPALEAVLPAPGTRGSDLMGPPALADVPDSLDPTMPQ